MFGRKRNPSDFNAEIEAHLELEMDRLQEQGLNEQEARFVARRAFGNVTRVQEHFYESGRWLWWDHLWQDVRFGLRTLAKSPGFATVAVLTLALGIGANTAIFSAVHTLLIRPLPVNDIDHLVFSVAMREGYDPFGTSLLEYEAFQKRGHSFSNMGLALQQSFNLLENGEPERIQGATAQADFFETLGVAPILGRSFSADEDRAGGPAAALVGYGLWRRRFGQDPGILGKPLSIDGRSTIVIGVLPPGFDLPNAAEIWVPYQRNAEGLPLAERAAHDHELVARLKPSVSLQQADGELKGIARDLEREYPRERAGWGVTLITLRQEVLGDLDGRIEKALLTLSAAVGFLLFICCGNVATLLLARGVTREREIALRRSLGADWWRLARQLLTESTLLALLGGLSGLLLAYLVLPVLRLLNPIQTVGFVAPLRDIRIDAGVLSFATMITIITAVIGALIPLAKAADSHNLMPLIKEGGQRGSAGDGGHKALAILIVAELAIAFPLLTGGGLLIQSFQKLQTMELGFRPDHLLTMHLVLSPAKYREFSQRVSFAHNMVDRIKSLPGVTSAGITTNMPLSAFISYDSVFTVEGHPPRNSNDVPITAHRLVTPEYLQTLGVTLVGGRLLNEHDRMGGLPVVVISEELAREGWPGEDPIGKRIKRVRPGQADFPWLTVVGIVKDVKEDRFNFRIDRPVWYLPYEQTKNSQPLDLVIRSNDYPNATSLVKDVRNAIRAVDPDQPVSNVTTMDVHLAGIVVTEKFSAVLMGVLAILGLTLAIIGLYGVMAYSMSRQTAEMGLRMALGATRASIFRMVVGRGMRLVIAGLCLGLMGALGLTRFLSGSLYRVNASDPLTFGLVAALLSLVALAACYVPARRATRVDPMMALRYQ